MISKEFKIYHGNWTGRYLGMWRINNSQNNFNILDCYQYKYENYYLWSYDSWVFNTYKELENNLNLKDINR